jgi:hypothetical protein
VPRLVDGMPVGRQEKSGRSMKDGNGASAYHPDQPIWK